MVPTDTTDARALSTASIDRTQGGTTADQDGTLVHIGAGVYLTAGHVLYQYVSPDDVRPADDYRITVAQGLTSEATFTIDAADFGTAFHNFGWGTDGGTDIAVVFGQDVGAPVTEMLLIGDPDGLAAPLLSFGYPAADGYNGATMIDVAGQMSQGSYQDVATSNGTASVHVSDAGMEVLGGQSGSGVWLDIPPAISTPARTFLTGIVTLDLTVAGGAPATGFEPIAEIYVELATLLEARGYDARDFPRQTIDLYGTAGTPVAGLTGTFFDEDIYGDTFGMTIDGGGGDDHIFGNSGADVLIDGDGVDRMQGGLGNSIGFDPNVVGPGDIFAMSADGRSDLILNFEDGIDHIDLSAWGVAGVADLTMEDHRSGRVIVRFDREALVIDDGARGLRAADLGADDFIFATGPAIIEGTGERDLLIGTAADEILRDFGGVDRMYGKAGADTFEMALDGATDQIKDFQNGIDVIDVSAWGIGALDQMSVEAHSAGRLILRAGDEILVLTGADGPLTTDQIDAADFIFA